MKKNKYRLETVIKVRRRVREDAALFVAQKRQELEIELNELEKQEAELLANTEEIVNARKRSENNLSGGTAAGSIVGHKVFIDGLKEERIRIEAKRDEQIRVVTTAEEALSLALERLTTASKELKVIENHKENWQSTESKRVKKQEQKLLDEISGILHESSKKISF